VPRALRAATLAFLVVACRSGPDGPRCPTNVATTTTTASPVIALGDGWVGGFDPIAGRSGPFLRIDFAAGLARLHPSLDRAPLGIIHPTLDAEGVRFAVDDGKHRLSFWLRRTSTESLDGTVTDEKGASAAAHLVHLSSAEPSAVDAAFAGTYAVDGDPRHLLFVDEGTLFDARDGSERRVFATGGSRAMVGAGVATAHPPAGTLSVDPSGVLRLDGRSSFVATRFDVKREEISFRSSDATLQGVLLSPKAGGRHPVVVNVHGSGRLTRRDHWANAMARAFLAEGVAVFLYDKRGVGDSGGEYVGRGARDTNNVSRENLERLAGDAAAAATMLSARDDVDPQRVGLVGLSQAGWIVPLAAKKTKAVRFTVLMSGPTVNTTVELAFSALAGDGGDSCLPIAEADRVAREHAPRTGFDPAPVIAAQDVPGLWLYGAVDGNIPVPSSVMVLEPMKKTHDFAVVVVPGAGHELYQVTRDAEDERLLSRGIAPAALEGVRAWLSRHVTRR
jgi:dienelactone hydrolase